MGEIIARNIVELVEIISNNIISVASSWLFILLLSVMHGHTNSKYLRHVCRAVCLSICPSVRMEQHVPHWTDFL